MKEFAGKVAVITGAASGIGFALAGRCVGESMKVVLADIDEADLTKAETELKKRRRNCAWGEDGRLETE